MQELSVAGCCSYVGLLECLARRSSPIGVGPSPQQALALRAGLECAVCPGGRPCAAAIRVDGGGLGARGELLSRWVDLSDFVGR